VQQVNDSEHADQLVMRWVRLDEAEGSQRAGLPTIRFHDLRHTVATVLLQDLPLKMVSELLGHSSVAITADHYGHVTPSMQKNAPAAMERLFGVPDDVADPDAELG
jgi:integrase